MNTWLRKGLDGSIALLARTWVWMSLVVAGAGAIGFGWGAWQNLCDNCPSIARIYTWEPQQTSKLMSRDGELINEIGIERRTPVSINALPAYVPQAFVAVEDRRFYEHSGFDPRGIARAVIGVLTTGSLSGGGGSTLTQQLARNMFTERIGFEKRITRKLKELQVALALERAYTKDQILEAYINQVNYAHGWWGIQTAARNYFGKNASELDPAEAALLAAIPNRPSTYSPLRHPDNALRRRNLVLDRMAREQYMSQEEADRWKREPLPTERAEAAEGVAPYFEEWVRQILDDRFGSQLYTAGLKIYTTLDVRTQEAAEEAMEWGWNRIEARPGFAHPRYAEYADKTDAFETAETPYLQGVFIALDPETGEVLAMIGGRDFRHSKFNRATQARRQPGSSFKPFVYASALASGIPASHVLVDAPVVLDQLSGDDWRPQNFTEQFLGPLTIREGLRRSINMIAIKLGMEVGLETVAQTARRMGVRTQIPRVPATAIGAADVIPLQMAEAYAGFARLGRGVRPFPILKVESADGEVLWEPQPERTVVLDSLVARILVDMLEDVVRQGTGYNAIRVVAGLPYEVHAAGKTGTTNGSTDVWFQGFTPNLQATVWFGMDAPQEIRPNATGGGDAAPVWGRFMKHVYYGPEPEEPEEGEVPEEPVEEWVPIRPIPEAWPMLPGLITRRVDRRTGKLASRWCAEEDQYQELYIPGTEPTEPCDRYSPTIFGTPSIPPE